jgi:hydrogenase maturation factor
MVAIVNNNLLKRESIAVESDGDFVVIHLGNVTAKIPYETALLLSQWIRMRAKEAKRRAGDNSRHWSAIGTLHDASVTRG